VTSSAPRVVVVGGGVVGVSCAYFLARGGADVVLLERERLGAGASFGNAGTVSAGHPPLNRPGRVRRAVADMLDPSSPLYVKPRWDPALWRWLVGFARRCSQRHVEYCMKIMAPLGMDALELFDELIATERIECQYRRDGYYDVCFSDRGLAAARHEASIIRRHGYHPEEVDGAELREREPALAPTVRGGVYYPDAATLQPALFLERLAEAAKRMGCDVREGVHVGRVLTHGDGAVGVQTHRGERIDADVVVLTTGPFSLRIAERFGVRIPVQPGKGYHRDIDVGPNGAPPLRIACVLNEDSVFCTPMDSYVRFAGTMEFSGENHALHAGRLRQLSRAARAAFPALGTARPVSEWCGLRPVSMDGLPIVGPVEAVKGLHVATGHGMLGLTLAPVTAEMITNLALRGGDDRIARLAPARFG
jgi:D-amino-acid dehydrogenase